MDPHDLVIRGRVRVWLNGTLIREARNLLVDSGLQLIAKRVQADVTDDAPSHVAIGDNGDDPTAADTDLIGVEHQRVAATSTLIGKIISLSATLGSIGSDKTVREMGVFNDASAGTMIARVVVDEFVLGGADVAQVTWELEFAP